MTDPPKSGNSTEELARKIDSFLHHHRSALSAEAAHLLEEASDELKRAHSNSSTEESAEAKDRAFYLLLRLFARPEVMDRFERWMDRMIDAL